MIIVVSEHRTNKKAVNEATSTVKKYVGIWHVFDMRRNILIGIVGIFNLVLKNKL